MTPFDPIYEILAKEVIYGFDKSETSLLANVFLATAGYRIDQVFNDPTTGFQALGLASLTPDKPSVLVFRGADELIDDAANADARGIGFNQFAANKDAIATWLAKFSSAALKPDLVGHSLGGTVAQTVAADLTDPFGNLVTFNAPGVNNTTVAQFQQKGATKNITHYIVNGDLVSLGGQGYLPGTVVLQSYTDGTPIDPIFALDKHIQLAAGRRLLSSPPAGYTQTTITVGELSNPAFSFNQETDFREFIAAYRATPNNVASALVNRGSVEALRVSPGFSFLGLIVGARTVVGLNQENVLVGDDRDNTADGKQGNDRINGRGGNDQLRGGTGDDTLLGGAGNDVLVGNSGQDLLIGVNAQANQPGQEERDRLEGGGNADVFVLGDRNQAFYDDGRRNDFALIVDFRGSDRIQLHGNRDDYEVRSINQGVGIFLTTGTRPEAIAILQNRTNFNLDNAVYM
jgi:Ca2+-binding RTX toxin-like protein